MVLPRNRRRNMSQPHKRLTVGSAGIQKQINNLAATLSTCRCLVDAFANPPSQCPCPLPITLPDTIDPLIQQECKQKGLGASVEMRPLISTRRNGLMCEQCLANDEASGFPPTAIIITTTSRKKKKKDRTRRSEKKWK